MCSVRTSRSPGMLTVGRAEALAVSDLPAGTVLSRAEVTAAIQHAVRAHGGVRGCAAQVAAAYGEYPETAAARMRWALAVVFAAYTAPRRRS